MPTVVIADDHPLFLDALRVTLGAAGLDVVGATDDGSAVVDLVEQAQPDVLLLDLQMPERSGLECLAELRTRTPAVKVIILSGADDRASIDEALALGAVCYVGKTVDPTDLAATVRIMASAAPVYVARRGGGRNDVETAPTPAGAVEDVGLTRRELEILRLVSEGMSNGQLARKLWVTEQTVKFHLSNVYRKLDVGNRTQAAARARALGLTDDPPAGRPGSADRELG